MTYHLSAQNESIHVYYFLFCVCVFFLSKLIQLYLKPIQMPKLNGNAVGSSLHVGVKQRAEIRLNMHMERSQHIPLHPHTNYGKVGHSSSFKAILSNFQAGWSWRGSGDSSASGFEPSKIAPSERVLAAEGQPLAAAWEHIICSEPVRSLPEWHNFLSWFLTEKLCLCCGKTFIVKHILIVIGNLLL